MESIVLGMAQIPVDEALGPLPAVVMVVVLVGFAIFMTFSIRGKIARRAEARPSARELVQQMKNHPRLVASDAQGFAADLHDLARRLGAQLDNKAQRLEKLIDEADQRIAALGANPAATPPVTRAVSRADTTPGPPQTNGRQQIDQLTDAVYELADAGRSPIQIAQHLDEQVGKVELILALRPG
jgi:hypothetical protein